MRIITNKQFDEIKRYLSLGASKYEIAHTLGMHWATVKKVSKYDSYEEYCNVPKERKAEMPYTPSDKPMVMLAQITYGQIDFVKEVMETLGIECRFMGK